MTTTTETRVLSGRLTDGATLSIDPHGPGLVLTTATRTVFLPPDAFEIDDLPETLARYADLTRDPDADSLLVLEIEDTVQDLLTSMTPAALIIASGTGRRAHRDPKPVRWYEGRIASGLVAIGLAFAVGLIIGLGISVEQWVL